MFFPSIFFSIRTVSSEVRRLAHFPCAVTSPMFLLSPFAMLSISKHQKYCSGPAVAVLTPSSTSTKATGTGYSCDAADVAASASCNVASASSNVASASCNATSAASNAASADAEESADPDDPPALDSPGSIPAADDDEDDIMEVLGSIPAAAADEEDDIMEVEPTAINSSAKAIHSILIYRKDYR